MWRSPKRALEHAGTLLAVAMAAWIPLPLSAEVAIGLAGPMTGRYAAYGAEMRAGAELAVEDLNQRGGVVGQSVTLKIADDGCEREAAASAARQLLGQDVRVVIGHHCESATLAAAGIYAVGRVVHIIPGISASDAAKRAGAHSFRLSARAADQGEVAAAFISTQYAGKRFAILHDRTRYGSAHAAAVRQALASGAAARGIVEVLFAPIVAGEKDYGAVVATLKALTPDLVYLGGYPTEAALLLKQMREAGLDATLMGPDALATREFWDLAGPVGEGTLITHLAGAAQSADADAIAARLRTRAVEPRQAALRTYAAVMLWADATAAAASTYADEVGKALVAKARRTLLGPVTFNAAGEGDLKSFEVFAWRKGALDELGPAQRP